MHHGTVARWNRTKGIGFIGCADFADDVFVHVSAFGSGDLIEGEEVSFEAEDEKNGKMRATHVEGRGVQPRDKAQAAGMYRGRVVRWNSAKGIGFVACRDFDEDVFVHAKSFGGGDLIEDREVTFEIEDQGNGKLRASNVRGPAVSSRRGDTRSDGNNRFNAFSRFEDRNRDRSDTDRYAHGRGSHNRREGDSGGYNSRDRSRPY